MATRWRRFMNLVSTAAARTLIALTIASFAAFFWAISLGGLVALASGDWMPGCGVNLTVALALAALLSCAALAVAPIWRGKREAPAPFPLLPTAGGAIGRKRSAAQRTH
jgi:hypothetical protein